MSTPFTSPFLRPAPAYSGGATNRALLPAAASTEISVDLRSGERHLHHSATAAATAPVPAATLPARPPIVRRPTPTAVCPACRAEFVMDAGRPRVYCSPACSDVGRSIRVKSGPRDPVDVGAECHAAVSAVCSAFKVQRESILNPTRGNRLATTPRLMAYALVKEMRPEASTTDIGRAFHRDHSSIVSGLASHKHRMARGAYAQKWREALVLARQEMPA